MFSTWCSQVSHSLIGAWALLMEIGRVNDLIELQWQNWLTCLQIWWRNSAKTPRSVTACDNQHIGLNEDRQWRFIIDQISWVHAPWSDGVKWLFHFSTIINSYSLRNFLRLSQWRLKSQTIQLLFRNGLQYTWKDCSQTSTAKKHLMLRYPSLIWIWVNQLQCNISQVMWG